MPSSPPHPFDGLLQPGPHRIFRQPRQHGPLQFLAGEEKGEVFDDMRGQRREHRPGLAHADRRKQAAGLHPLLRQGRAVHQDIRIVPVNGEVHRHLIMDRMVLEDRQGIGDDPFVGGQRLEHIGLDIQAHQTEGGGAADQGQDKQEQGEVDSLFVHGRWRRARRTMAMMAIRRCAAKITALLF